MSNEEGTKSEGEQLLQKYIEKTPQTWEDYALSGYAFLSLGKNKDAEKRLREAAKIHPRDFVLFSLWLQALRNLGETTRELSVFRLIERIRPRKSTDWDNHGAWLRGIDDRTVDGIRLVVQIAGQRQPTKKEMTFRGILDDYPNKHYTWYMLGLELAKRDADEEAIDAYKRCLDLNPGNADAWFSLGDSLGYIGEHQKARDAFQKAIELDDKKALWWTQLGITSAPFLATLFMSYLAGSSEEILHSLEISFNPKNIERFPETNLNDAEKAFRTAIDLDADYYPAWQWLGTVLLLNGDMKNAEDALLRALKLNENAISCYILALFYKRAERSEETLEMMTKGEDYLLREVEKLTNARGYM